MFECLISSDPGELQEGKSFKSYMLNIVQSIPQSHAPTCNYTSQEVDHNFNALCCSSAFCCILENFTLLLLRTEQIHVTRITQNKKKRK